jgi:hypothetical protein
MCLVTDTKYHYHMQNAFLRVMKYVCEWILSMTPISDFSVRVTDMYSKLRKTMERFLTQANMNGTSEIKHQVKKNVSCDL